MSRYTAKRASLLLYTRSKKDTIHVEMTTKISHNTYPDATKHLRPNSQTLSRDRSREDLEVAEQLGDLAHGTRSASRPHGDTPQTSILQNGYRYANEPVETGEERAVAQLAHALQDANHVPHAHEQPNSPATPNEETNVTGQTCR